MSNKDTVLFARKEYKSSEAQIVQANEIMPGMKARFAMSIMERWAMVAGDPDGEDSAGRSKLRLIEPDEVVHRACEISDHAFEEMEKRGWIDRIDNRKIMEQLKNAESGTIMFLDDGSILSEETD